MSLKEITVEKLIATWAMAQIDEEEIAVGGANGDIRIYKRVKSDSNQCTKVLKGHSTDINCLLLYEDKKKMWSISDGQCQKTFLGHTGYVYSVILYQLHNKVLEHRQ